MEKRRNKDITYRFEYQECVECWKIFAGENINQKKEVLYSFCVKIHFNNDRDKESAYIFIKLLSM